MGQIVHGQAYSAAKFDDLLKFLSLSCTNDGFEKL